MGWTEDRLRLEQGGHDRQKCSEVQGQVGVEPGHLGAEWSLLVGGRPGVRSRKESQRGD
jgi:hypothetical protein